MRNALTGYICKASLLVKAVAMFKRAHGIGLETLNLQKQGALQQVNSPGFSGEHFQPTVFLLVLCMP